MRGGRQGAGVRGWAGGRAGGEHGANVGRAGGGGVRCVRGGGSHLSARAREEVCTI